MLYSQAYSIFICNRYNIAMYPWMVAIATRHPNDSFHANHDMWFICNDHESSIQRGNYVQKLLHVAQDVFYYF